MIHQAHRTSHPGKTEKRSPLSLELPFAVDPPGKKKFLHGNDRQEILVDSSGRQNFLQKKFRQEILVDPPVRQIFPLRKNREEIPVYPPSTLSSRHEVHERQ